MNSPHIFLNRRTLILTMSDIKSMLPLEACIDLQRRAFIAHASGDAFDAPSSVLTPGDTGRRIKVLAGYLGAPDESMAVKILARFPQNPPGMNLGSILALFDAHDGFPVAIMDAVYITAVRTAAGGALSALYCARQASTRVGVLGSGVLARFTLLAVTHVLPGIERVSVFSRSSQQREAFARDVGSGAGFEVVAVESARAAVSDADIIITATSAPVPVLTDDMVTPSVHIVAVGAATEIEPSVLARARVIADGRQVATDHGKWRLAVDAGTVAETDLQGELGDVISGRVPGRIGDADITLFDSTGLAVQDVACARYLHDKAQELGRGTWIDLGLGDLPYV